MRFLNWNDGPARRALVVGTAVAVCGACGGGSSGTGPGDTNNPYGITATGPGVLSVSPLDTSTYVWGTPLGKLGPPGHVLPTDHVYLYFVDPWSGQQQNYDCRARPVRAAGSGVVTFVYQSETETDTKVNIQMTKTFHYFYDHVILKAGIGVGTRVQAGDTIATTNGRCPSIDLGVYDLDVTPSGLINPKRYGDVSYHVASPYKYFAEPLRTWLYAHSRIYEGTPANKDGRIDWGIRGRLSGDWFHVSLANASASVVGGPDGWGKTLSFAYDWFDNSQPRISIGGTISTPGILRPAPGDPDPSTVTVSSGLVVYQGSVDGGYIEPGWVLVQMLTDERIRVEYVIGTSPRPTAFTGAAQEYVR